MGDDTDEDLQRAIREHENRPPDRPWRRPLDENRRARILAECERRGIDPDKVLAECERRGYWEWFDCGEEADGHDESPGPARPTVDWSSVTPAEFVEYLESLKAIDAALKPLKQGVSMLLKFERERGLPAGWAWFHVQRAADAVSAGIDEPPTNVEECILSAFEAGTRSEKINAALVEATLTESGTADVLEKRLDARLGKTREKNAKVKRAARVPSLNLLSIVRRLIP